MLSIFAKIKLQKSHDTNIDIRNLEYDTVSYYIYFFLRLSHSEVSCGGYAMWCDKLHVTWIPGEHKW